MGETKFLHGMPPQIDEFGQVVKPAGVANFCSNCGAKLPLGANFCPECGFNIREYLQKNTVKEKDADERMRKQKEKEKKTQGVISMPNEVDYQDEFLFVSNWRYCFSYLIQGELIRYSGVISDYKSNTRRTFRVVCNDIGYVDQIFLYHPNGILAANIKVGQYLQNLWDNIINVDCYSQTGEVINQELFGEIYGYLLDEFEAKCTSLKEGDCGC